MNFYFYIHKKENQAGLFYSLNDSNHDIIYCDISTELANSYYRKHNLFILKSYRYTHDMSLKIDNEYVSTNELIDVFQSEEHYMIIFNKTNCILEKYLIKNNDIHCIDYFSLDEEWTQKKHNQLLIFCKDCFIFDNDIETKIINYSISCHLDKQGNQTFINHYLFMMNKLSSFKNMGQVWLYENMVKNISQYLIFKNDDFYYLSEKMAKVNIGIDNILYQIHPLYTNNWNIIDNPKLNGVNKKYVDMFPEDVNVDILSQMYSHDKIGPNGMNIIYEFVELVKKINPNLSFNVVVQIYYVIDEINITPKNLVNYLAKNIFYNSSSFYELMRHLGASISSLYKIYDTIEMAKQLGYEVNKDILNNVEILHDEYSQQILELRHKENEENFIKECKNNLELLNYEPLSEKYTIIAPLERKDLDNEGRNMRNCVASYYNKVASGKSKILFMRQREFVDKSYITVEFNKHNNAVQFYRKANRAVSQEEESFIREWEYNIQNNIRTIERKC